MIATMIAITISIGAIFESLFWRFESNNFILCINCDGDGDGEYDGD